MSWRPDYLTLAAFKTYLRIGDTVDDAELAVAVTAASRAVDHACNRQFGVEASAVARVYEASPAAGGWRAGSSRPFGGRAWVEIDDLMTTSDLAVKFDQDADATFEETVTAYDLWPWNAAADGKPWTHIVFRSTATAPVSSPRAVEVTAKWGWTAVPAQVAEAARLQAARFFKRRDAPFGVAGSPDVGSELRLLARLDPDVAVLVGSLKRMWVAA